MKKIEVIRNEQGQPVIKGYAAIFDTLSKDRVKGQYELVRKGAFDKVLQEGEDVIFTVEHGKKPFARMSNSTLTLTANEVGLYYEATLPNTTEADELAEMIEQGYYQENSFNGKAEVVNRAGQREIVNLLSLTDVSVVGAGAYTAHIEEVIRDDGGVIRNDGGVIRYEAPGTLTTGDMYITTDASLGFEPKEKLTVGDPEIVIRNEEKGSENLKTEAMEDEKVEKMEEEVKEEQVEKAEETTEEKVEKMEADPEVLAKLEEVGAKLDKLLEEEVEEEEVERSKTNVMEHKWIEELKRSLDVSGTSRIEVKRAAGDGETTSYTNAIPKNIAPLDIVGKKPIWMEMGCDYVPNVQGTFSMPYDNPQIGEKLAELAPVTKQVETDLGTLVTPNRYSAQRIFTKETLASASPESIAKWISDLEAACDRAVTTEVMTAVLAVAQEQATVTSIDEAGIDTLSGAADIDNPFSLIMSRATFYGNKGTKIDAGSGVNLMTKSGMFGETWEGDSVFFSSLFSVNNVIAGGDMSKIVVHDYNQSEIIIDPYTLADEGQVKVTVVKLMNVAARNPFALVKSGTIV